MSDTARYTPSGGHPMPSGLSMNTESSCPPLQSSQPGSPSNDIASVIESHGHCRPDANHTGVQPLPNGSVHTLSNYPAHTLSTEELVKDRTGSKQGLDTPLAQPLDRGNRQGVDTLFEQGMDRGAGQPPDSRGNDPEPTRFLRRDTTSWTTNQDKVLSLFRTYGHCIINHKVIAEKLNIPYGTVRNIIRRLVGAGMIRTGSCNTGAVQGVEIWYCGPDAHQATDETSQVWTRGEQRAWTAPEQGSWTGDKHPAYKEDREKDRESINIEKNQSILTLSKEQIDELWPNMGKAGLFARDIQKVKAAMDMQGIENNPEKIIAQSLRFIDWQLAQGPIIDQHGKEVAKPVAYWRASMMRNGCYQMPPGYIDPEVLAMRQLANEENARLEARRALEKLQAEKDKQDRREELDTILRALADERASHPLWTQVEAEWTPNTRLEVGKNPQAIVNSPGVAATTRIALRKIYGWPE